ncbi:MAG: TonB-dependent receptor [Dechloromonas sp.]|nr:TonB-dependent receptor [Dechloromonas sp.]
MGYRIRPLAAVAVLFSGAVAPQFAAAQGAEAKPAVLDDVVVSADKLQPVPVSSAVSSSSLEQMRPATSDTASLLRNIPGVSTYGAGGVSSLPVIRGLADDRIRIKVDGMDLIASCPNHMNPPLSYIDPTNVGTLRVYSGITPVSVGGDSIAGTIIADTLAPVFAAPGQDYLATGQIGGFYRSNGNAWGANIAATIASENFNLTYTGSSVRADNYKAGGNFKTTTATGRVGHTLPLDEVGSTAYESLNQMLSFALKGGNHLVEAKFGFQHIPEQLYPNQRMDMLDNEQKTFNLRYLGQFDWGLFEARAYYEKVDPHYMDFGPDKRFWYGAASGGSMAGSGAPCSPISANCAAGMPMYTKSSNTGVNVKADVNLDAQNLIRVGGLYQHYTLDDWWPPSGAAMWPGTFDNINDGSRDRLGLFGEWESRLNAQWLTLLGARYERVKTDAGNVRGYSTAPAAMGNQYADAAAFNAQDRQRTDNNWDLTALARYTRDANSDIEFGVARKVRSPNLYERYTWSTWSMAAVMNNFVGDGNGYFGDIDLKPEQAHTVSATFDLHAADRRSELRVTPYYTRVTDYIDAIRCTAGASCTPANRTTTNQFVVLQYANQSAELYGIDVSGRMPLASTDFGDFGLTGLLAYTHGKNLDTDEGLYNIMPFNGKLALTHALGGWNGAVEVVAVAAKDDVSDVRNEIKTAGYGLTNLRGSYTWKQVRIDLGVDNLFDKFYALPLGGAYTGQGTTMMLNGIPWGIAVPGMGRSIYTGVTFKF